MKEKYLTQPEKKACRFSQLKMSETGMLRLPWEQKMKTRIRSLKSKKFKTLSFLTDSELFTLLKQPRELLPDAAAVFLEKYSPTQPKVDYTEEDQEMPLDEMVIILCEMQDFMTALPIEGGLFCYHSAFKDLPYAHSSQDIQRIKYLFEQKIWEQFKDQDKMWTKVIMVIALLGATGGLIYILSMAFGS